MKKIFQHLIFLPSIALVIVQLSSCNTTSQDRIAVVDKVKCEGTCSGSDGEKQCTEVTSGNEITCSCVGCKMIVESSKINLKDGGVSKSILTDRTKYEVTFSQDFKKYMDKNYPDTTYQIDSLEITKFEDVYSEQYFYKITGGEDNSVLYVSTRAAAGVETIEYDCSGACNVPNVGCKEVYTVSTGKVSCTCTSCTLTKTVISKK